MLKKLHQIWSAAVSLHLHAAQLVRESRISNTIPLYSIYAHPIRSAPPCGFMGSIYAHSYGQPILVRLISLVRCTVHTGHRVMCSLNSSIVLVFEILIAVGVSVVVCLL